MTDAAVEHELTLWMTDDIPDRMFFAGRRWRVTDIPTRLRGSIWEREPRAAVGMYGWRFQATDDDGTSVVFDVFKAETEWHVHRTYV
ncbi:hypothetical protein [Microbacterium sp. CPCC 204701]|uniref:hypothetical protein n=1 Tax=Microbacterium sp. CPCC 204701 TaxID=2493084 RepID=UPI000FD74160|nr:hypothetical protein [Microbacterium sp. CPCC 204701]